MLRLAVYFPERLRLMCARLAWLASLLLLAGCQRRAHGDLLEVRAVSPAEVMFGDSLLVRGDGFALGHPATVRLRGDVFRMGLPARSVDVELRGHAQSPHELAVLLPREQQRRFCGTSDDASHATFRGELTIAVAASLPGAPPVTGTLHDAVLELYPATKTREAEVEALALGRRVLDFLGVEVAPSDAAGLSVVRVAAGSRSSAAGIEVGDRIVRAGGLSVLQPSDLVSEPARRIELGIVRGAEERSVWVNYDGFFQRPPRSLGWSSILVAAAALGWVLLASPLAGLWAWLAGNRAERAPASPLARVAGRSTARPPRAAWLWARAGGVSGTLAFLAVAAALSSPLWRAVPVDPVRGLLVAMFVSALAITALELVAGGYGGRRWSLVRALRAAKDPLLVTAPAAAAIGALYLASGVDAADWAREQGPYPWTWNALRDPGLAGLFVLMLATTLPRWGRPDWRLSRARPQRRLRARPDEHFLGWIYACSTCAVAVTAFLGGGAWPGQAPGAAGPDAQPLAVAVVMGKYTLLVVVMAVVRWLALDLDKRQCGSSSWRAGLPLSLLGVATTLACGQLARVSPFASWLFSGFGPAASLVVVLLAAAAVAGWARARGAARPAAPLVPVSPWL